MFYREIKGFWFKKTLNFKLKWFFDIVERQYSVWGHFSVERVCCLLLAYHLHVVCGSTEVCSVLPWWHLHNCNQPSLLCFKIHICIPNTANLPTLISNTVTIYCSSSDKDEIFIMWTDEGVGCRLLHCSLGHSLPPVGDCIMYVSVSMTRADRCLQRDCHWALMMA